MYQEELIRHGVKIFVRRGGPNYQEGLRIMRDLGMKIVKYISLSFCGIQHILINLFANFGCVIFIMYFVLIIINVGGWACTLCVDVSMGDWAGIHTT